MNNYNNQRLSFYEVYQQSFNKKNLPTRLFIIILGLIAEVPIFIANFYILVIVEKISGVFGFEFARWGDITQDYNSFIALMHISVPLFLIHVLLFVIFRFAIKFRTFYLDLITVLLITCAILSPYLKAPLNTYIFADIGFIITIGYTFVTITFISFIISFVTLERSARLHGWQKIMFALLLSIPAGLLVSRLLWIPIMTFYLK